MLFTEEYILDDESHVEPEEPVEPTEDDLEEEDLETDIDEEEIFNLENSVEDDDYLD
jgi:hypothetical protein